MKRLNFAARYYYPDCPGGCEKVFYELYKRARKDYNIKIISSYDNKSKFPENSDLFTKKDFNNSLVRYLYYAFNLSIKAFKSCDLVHANNIEVIRLKHNIPYVLTIHHVGHFINKEVRKQTFYNKFLKKLLVWQANRADKIITVSGKTKKDLKKMGVKTSIIVIPNGVDLETFKPLKVKKKDKFVITHLSRVSPEKAQHLTIQVYKDLPEKIIKNVELRIAGYVSDKEYYQRLKTKNVKFQTNLSENELVKVINESDLIVFPTLMSEGFGLIVLEAMACGVPVLASNQKAIKEAGGNVCQYFKQGDLKDYKKKLIKLYKDGKLRKKLKKKGLERVKKFSWDAVYKRHKKLYEELIG